MSEQPPAAAPIWRRPGLWLVVCLVVGLAARLGAIAYVHTMKVRVAGGQVVDPSTQPLFPDSFEYLRAAEGLLKGKGLGVGEGSEIGRMPGYPVFLAAVEVVFGYNLLAMRVMQALLGVVSVWLAYLLGRELFGTKEALAAAAVTAVYPFFLVFSVLLLSEALFITLLLAGAVCLAKALGSGSESERERASSLSPSPSPFTFSAVCCGLFFGLATLVRASFLLVVPLTAVGWVAAKRFRRAAAWRASLMLATCALVMVPWVARNWRVTGGHLVLTTLRTGPSLYEGLNPRAEGGPMMDDLRRELDGPAVEGMSEYERDRFWRQRAVEFARENPGRVLGLALKKLGRFWNVTPNLVQLQSPLHRYGLGVPYVVVMLFALVGLARSWRRGDVVLILMLPVVYYAVVHMVFVGSVRYRVPIMPLLVVLAGHGIAILWRRRKGGQGTATHRDRADVQRIAIGGRDAGAGAGGPNDEAGGGGG